MQKFNIYFRIGLLCVILCIKGVNFEIIPFNDRIILKIHQVEKINFDDVVATIFNGTPEFYRPHPENPEYFQWDFIW